jgi:hypothetical protein
MQPTHIVRRDAGSAIESNAVARGVMVVDGLPELIPLLAKKRFIVFRSPKARQRTRLANSSRIGF